MLRIILRHTFNALLFACILLLLCSFERLCRYDFAQIQLYSSNGDDGTGTTSASTNQGEDGEDVLQVDHFVFWGGIPSWERSVEARNPVSLGLFKFMSFSSAKSAWTYSSSGSSNKRGSSSSSSTSSSKNNKSSATKAPPTSSSTEKSEQDLALPTTTLPELLLAEQRLQEQKLQGQQQQEHSEQTATPLVDANLQLRRQIRHHKRLQKSRTNDETTKAEVKTVASSSNEKKVDANKSPSSTSTTATVTESQRDATPIEKVAAHDDRDIDSGGQPTATTSTFTPPPRLPEIGFILHLTSCDHEAIASWQTIWTSQIVDQPFLFHVLLAPTVHVSCRITLQQEFQERNGNGQNGGDADPDSDTDSNIVYQVSQTEHLALALQTCQDPEEWLLQLKLQEALYYDASKAKGRLRSSATMRRFSRTSAVTSIPPPQEQAVTTDTATASTSATSSTRPSVFQCTGGEQKPAFCDTSVLDCPWFQYSPPITPPLGEQIDEAETLPVVTAVS